MRDYVKPMIIANEELAEGVYAGGSGASTTSSSGVTVTVPDAYNGQDNGRYGNYYFNVSGVEHGATYQIVYTFAETEQINGLSSVTGSVVSGNVATQTKTGDVNDNKTWHIYVTFSNGSAAWDTSKDQIPKLTVTFTKLS